MAMKNTAVIIYIAPKIASNYTRWCLERVEGMPALAHLLTRLKTGFPLGEMDFVVACHKDGVMPAMLEEALQGLDVKVFSWAALSRMEVFSEWIKVHPEIQSLLVFPEDSI